MITTKLIGSKSIGAAVRSLLCPSRVRRVAIVGFVGRDAHTLLDDVRGLDVYCWPSPTCTSARGLMELANRGARVHFVEDLHTKLYWADGTALVGSANLSYNGIGGGLIEHMAFVDLPESDLDELIGSLAARAASNADLERLRRLNERNQPGPGVPDPRPEADQTPTFEEWWTSGCRDRDRIRLSWYFEERDAASSTREAARQHGFEKPLTSWISARRESTLPPDSWVLYLKTDEHGRVGTRRTTGWLFVHGLSKMSESEPADLDPGQEAYHWEAYQVGDVQDPPFRLDRRLDRRLRLALAKAWRQVIEPGMGEGHPTEDLLASPPAEFWEAVRSSLFRGIP